MWEEISIQYLNGGEMLKSTKKEPKPKVISLHSLKTEKRLTQPANPRDIKSLTYNTWRTKYFSAA